MSMAEEAIKSALERRLARSVVIKDADAYERLIMDVIRGNQTLFMRGDEVEATWAWTDPIIKGWQDRNDVPKHYDQGSSGPDDALMLLHREGRRWRDIKE